jgi:hypothetical protein
LLKTERVEQLEVGEGTNMRARLVSGLEEGKGAGGCP